MSSSSISISMVSKEFLQSGQKYTLTSAAICDSQRKHTEFMLEKNFQCFAEKIFKFIIIGQFIKHVLFGGLYDRVPSPNTHRDTINLRNTTVEQLSLFHSTS